MANLNLRHLAFPSLTGGFWRPRSLARRGYLQVIAELVLLPVAHRPSGRSAPDRGGRISTLR
jgi:hypothetical protein